MRKKITELLENKGFVKYFKNASWAFADKFIRIITALFIGVWVTRYLGPKDFGILSYAQSIVGLIAAFSSLGLNGLLARELVKNPEDRYTLLGTSFILQMIGSTILFGILVVFAQINENDALTKTIILLLGGLTFLDSFGIITIYFQSIVKNKLMVIPSLVGLVISSILKVSLILSQAKLLMFVYVLIFDTAFLIIGLLYFYRKQNQKLFKWNFSSKKATSLLKDSWPLVLSGIIVSIYMKVDQFMIKEIIGVEAVGKYAAAARLSEAWGFIPGIICASVFPAIVNAKKVNEELYLKRIQNLYDLMVLISLLIALILTFTSDWLVNFLYGVEFIESGPVLSLHIWGGVFLFLGSARAGWILNENLQRYTSMYLGVGMVCNLLLNLYFIPKNGIWGAALATLISQSISVLFAPLLFKKTRLSFFMMMKSLTFYNFIFRK